MAYVTEWVQWYNQTWRHGSLGGFTPESVYNGTWEAIFKVRDKAKAIYAQAHPERFINKVAPVPRPKVKVTINMDNDGTIVKPTMKMLIAG